MVQFKIFNIIPNEVTITYKQLYKIINIDLEFSASGNIYWSGNLVVWTMARWFRSFDLYLNLCWQNWQG